MNLAPRQLRIFVALAHSLNFSRTAELFFVTQPTLSKLVRDIEAEMQVRLFDRTTRSVKLTPDGEALLAVAARVVEDYEQSLAELKQVASRQSRSVAVAALPTLAGMLLPGPVAALQAERPPVAVRVHDVLSDTALELLRARKVDFAMTSLDATHRDLAYEEVVRDRFVLLASKAQSVAHKTWREADLLALPLISLPRGSSTRHSLDAIFARQGLTFRPVLELSNLASIGKFVQAGCGIGLLPELGARMIHEPGLRIVPLKHAPERSIGIITRQGEALSPAAARLVAAVRQQAAVPRNQ